MPLLSGHLGPSHVPSWPRGSSCVCFTRPPGPQECPPNRPHPSFRRPSPRSCGEEGPGRESRRRRPYLPELLDAPEDPHHAVDLLLQAPRPVLHPACGEQRGVRRARLVPAQPSPAPRGAREQPPLRKPECTCDSFETQAGRPRHWRTVAGGESGLRFQCTERVRQLQGLQADYSQGRAGPCRRRSGHGTLGTGEEGHSREPGGACWI